MKLFGSKELVSTTLIIATFGIAMGFLESAVVVYLRELYYPENFEFPLSNAIDMPQNIVAVELFREAATIIMLICVGYLAGKNLKERFAYFLLSFAIWDIFYYVFLYFALGWPSSLFTWDLLFLIPVPWIGPVYSPLIICCLMILLSLELLWISAKKINTNLNVGEWFLLILGSLIVILSWILDFLQFAKSVSGTYSLWNLSIEQLNELNRTFIPNQFDWEIFIVGCSIILTTIFRVYTRVKSLTTNYNR